MPIPPYLVAAIPVVVKDVAAIGAGAAALATFIRSTAEYIRQGTQKRIELYLNMRAKFDGNEKFTEIRNLLEKEAHAKATHDKEGYETPAMLFPRLLSRNARTPPLILRRWPFLCIPAF
jgi:hypothetical protein